MKRAIAVLLLVSLLSAGAALAARGDPQKEITPADQARAKAMLLRKADFGFGFQSIPSGGQDADVYCPALDESDLTLTGEAESPTFQGGVEFVSSLSQVYESRADSSTSWRRGTSPAGEKCARVQLGRAFERQGGWVETFKKIPFPALAEKSVAYRLVVTTQNVRAFVDVVVLKQGRAQAALLLGSALTPMPRDVELELARTVAGRMAKAMRGA